MSEAEKRRRQAYRQGRKKWIMLELMILAGILLLATIFSILYSVFDKAYFIGYTEKSDVDYRVLLKENDFYDSPYAEPDKAYVTALIDKVEAGFAYGMLMNAREVHFEYSYAINAILKIADRSGTVLYEHADELLPERQVSKTGNALTVMEHVSVDYGTYNTMAQAFTSFYGLENTVSTLVIEMRIDVIGASEEFTNDTSNHYVVALNVPLAEKTVTMNVTSSVDEGNNYILGMAKDTVKNVFMVLTVVFWILTALGGIFILVFIYITRNDDINYEIRVKRLLQTYRSFIQKLTNHFDEQGYTILMLSSFSEMLEIRDTIQSPILMDENDDKTCTRFLIPAASGILYVFEIKAEDFDQIYADEPVEEIIEEAAETPDISLDQIDYVDSEVIEDRQDGVEVISVVWPGKEKRNKLYRYDPNGEKVDDGDIVLVPSRDHASGKDIVRKAAVAHGNHFVDPATLTHPLKKIIAVVKRKAEDLLGGKAEDEKSNNGKK